MFKKITIIIAPYAFTFTLIQAKNPPLENPLGIIIDRHGVFLSMATLLGCEIVCYTLLYATDGLLAKEKVSDAQAKKLKIYVLIKSVYPFLYLQYRSYTNVILLMVLSLILSSMG